VEVFVYENLKRNGDDEFITLPGKQMFQDFSDTQWNTETSVSSFDKKYKGCTTKLYYINEYNKNTNAFERKDSYILFTYSYVSDPIDRVIKLKRQNGDILEYYHKTQSAGGWYVNNIPNDVESISVYENGKFLYKENVSDCISFANVNSI
jgi:hypothetical protein